MRWPWVSRTRLEAVQLDAQRYTNLLEKELEYYRSKFEAEKERADRAVDSLVERAGVEPLSAPVRQERVDASVAAKSMMEQAHEIFAEVGESVLDSEGEEVPPEDVAPAEKSVNDRLAAIAARFLAKTSATAAS